MAIKDLSKNWSTALWRILEPRTLLKATVGGLRLVLDRLGGFRELSSDRAPVGTGSCLQMITVPLTSIVPTSGAVAGIGSTPTVAGGDGDGFLFRVCNLPKHILMFYKSATTVDNVLMRGIDFIESSPGCYLFKADPSFYGICSEIGGVSTCSWLYNSGTAVYNRNQDRLSLYRGSTSYRVNRQIGEVIRSTVGSNGLASTAQLLCCGADICSNIDAIPIETWQEGDTRLCKTSDGEVVRLPALEYSAQELSRPIRALPLSRVLIYAAAGRYYQLYVDDTAVIEHSQNIKPLEELIAIPMADICESATTIRNILGRRGFNTIDTTGLTDAKLAALVDPYVSKVSATYTTQQLKLTFKKLSRIDGLILYYSDVATADISEFSGTSVADCLARASESAGAWLFDAGDLSTKNNTLWCSLNASVVGMLPRSNYKLVGASAFQHNSTYGEDGDILEHVGIYNEFIHPGICVCISATH